MAHLVTDLQNDKGDLILKGCPAWHGLGTVFEDGKVITTADALKYGGLDFEVKKEPLIYRMPECEDKTFDDSYFTYRTDLGIVLGKQVGKTYGILQNKDILSVMDSVLEHGYCIESAGALDSGRLVFITAKLQNLEVSKNDLINQFLVLSTTHDGSASAKAYLTNVRIVCNNTLQASLKDATNTISIRHTATSKDRMQEASEILRASQLSGEVSVNSYKAMQAVKISKQDLVSYVANCLLDSKDLALAKRKDKKGVSTRKLNIIDSVMDFSLNGVGQKEIYGTAWGAYNAITGYFSNVKNHMNQQTRFNSLLFGDDNRKMQNAFNVASDFNDVQTVDLDWLYSTAVSEN